MDKLCINCEDFNILYTENCTITSFCRCILKEIKQASFPVRESAGASSSWTASEDPSGFALSGGSESPAAAQAPVGPARPGVGGRLFTRRVARRAEGPPLHREAGASASGRCPRQGRSFEPGGGASSEGPAPGAKSRFCREAGLPGRQRPRKGRCHPKVIASLPGEAVDRKDGKAVQPLSVLGVRPAPEASGVSRRARCARSLGLAHLTPHFYTGIPPNTTRYCALSRNLARYCVQEGPDPFAARRLPAGAAGVGHPLAGFGLATGCAGAANIERRLKPGRWALERRGALALGLGKGAPMALMQGSRGPGGLRPGRGAHGKTEGTQAIVSRPPLIYEAQDKSTPL